MRWRSITLCALCLLWMVALPSLMYEPRWRYELAILPGFPLSVAIPLAMAKSAAVVLPFAVVYLCLRMEKKYSGAPVPFVRFAAFVLTALVVLRVVTLLFFTSAAIR